MKKKGGKKPKKSVQPPGSAKRKARQNTATKPNPAEQGPNPYDVFQNRRRRNPVLNERARGEHRNLARSRTLAASERTQKLLREQLVSGRSSKFRDGRIAADDDDDDSNVKRLVRLRQKEAKRSFTLGKEEELMHEGQPLSTLEDAELRKSSTGEDDEEFDNIDDIVQQGRERKALAMQEKAEHERQLGELDKDFTDVMGELNFNPPKAQRPIERVEADSYDRLLKEMTFQKRATATERTKTPEEIAQEKAEKLEALERERLARADGLADDAPLNASDEEMDQEGEAPSMAMAEEPADEGEEGEEEEEKEDDVEVSAEAAAGQGAGGDKDDDDRLGEDCVPLMSTQEANKLDAMKNGPGEDNLPFAPECPENRLAMEKLLQGRSPKAALKLIQRVRARTAVSLSAENRSKIKAFFTALLDFALTVLSRSDGDISSRGMTLVYALRRPLLELAREHTEEASTYFSEKLKALGPDTAPRAEELACLKLIAMLFPVTDYQHPVVTPALLLADHWAAQLANMGAGIEDLVSEATMLWGTLYELLLPGKKFCASFFQLGGALLESCASSAAQGRSQCREAAVDIAALMAKALRLLAEEASALAIVAREDLLRPALQRIPSSNREAISKALGLLEESTGSSQALTPLRLFESGPAQIKMLDPIFHEEGDRPTRGMEASESKQLERRLNKERRSAARQLSRDAAVVQRIQNRKDDIRRATQGKEKKRVRRIMEVEKQELKQMATEFDKSMDTSFGSYSKTKQRKKENRRMAGNATAENPKRPPERKSDKGSASGANAEKSGGGKKKKEGQKK